MKIFGKTIWQRNNSVRCAEPSRFEYPVRCSARQKYVELINMYLSTMTEEDMLKLLVMLVETKKSRMKSERDDVRDDVRKLLVDDKILKSKL